MFPSSLAALTQSQLALYFKLSNIRSVQESHPLDVTEKGNNFQSQVLLTRRVCVCVCVHAHFQYICTNLPMVFILIQIETEIEANGLFMASHVL